jgi:aryl-alcohol dehydrogenase
MRAAVLRTPGEEFEVEELTLGPLRTDEVVVQIHGVGVCHSDLLHRDGYPAPVPVVLGHEGAGVVVELGSADTGFEVGDHVVLSYDSCGTCRLCRTGRPAYCESFIPLNNGGKRADGTTALLDAHGAPVSSHWFGQSSFAELAVAHTRTAVKVDRDLPIELLGPLGCGFQTGAGTVLNQPGLDSSQSLLVVGAGAVGLSAVMAARSLNLRDVYVVDPIAARRALAMELGATRTFDPADPEVYDEIRALSGGGTHFAIDTSGRPAVLPQVIATCRVGSTIAAVGAPLGPSEINPVSLLGKVLTYRIEGDATPQLFVPRLIDLWRRGLFPFDRLVETYPLADINRATEDALSGAVIKPVLTA